MMTQKAKELIDSYIWEIDSNGDFNLVKKTDQDPDKLYYDFLDLPDEYMSQVQVKPTELIF